MQHPEKFTACGIVELDHWNKKLPTNLNQDIIIIRLVIIKRLGTYSDMESLSRKETNKINHKTIHS